MGKVILLLLIMSVSAYAEELERFPGWKINKIEKAQSEDGSYEIGPDYFGLTPPDSRPAVTISARVAKQLKAGEVQPEDVYGQGAGKKEEKTAKAEDVYRPGGGYTQADQITSTLPGYDPGGDAGGIGARAVDGAYGTERASGATGGNPYGSSYANYGEASSGASSADSGVIPAARESAVSAADAKPSSSGSGFGSASAASATARPVGPISGSATVAAGSNPFSSGLKMANNGLKENSFKSADGKSADAEDGVGNGNLTNRSIAQTDVPPPCPRGRYVYSDATYLRLKLPRGCNLIHISAWGAGGGSGTETYQSGGRDGGTMTRDVPGGGGSFMSTSWQIDADKYDLVVVVGATGKKTVQTVTQVRNSGGGESGTTTQVTYSGGEGGFPGAKDSSGMGGGGGGYSGVFLVSKTDASKTMKPDWAMAIGNGGAGGAGGGAGGSMDVRGTAPSATMTNQIGEQAKGQKPGFQYYPERGSAGNPGTSGKVIIEYF